MVYDLGFFVIQRCLQGAKSQLELLFDFSWITGASFQVLWRDAPYTMSDSSHHGLLVETVCIVYIRRRPPRSLRSVCLLCLSLLDVLLVHTGRNEASQVSANSPSGIHPGGLPIYNYLPTLYWSRRGLQRFASLFLAVVPPRLTAGTTDSS